MKCSVVSFLVLICTMIIPLGCAHRQNFKESLQSQKCEDALTQVPENHNVYKVSSVSQQALGYAVSYSFVGAAYTAQVLWDVTAGVTSVVVLCAPAIALQTVARNSMSAQPNDTNQQLYGPLCLPADIKPLLAPQLGKKAYRSTETLRCPPLTGISESLRRVARCFADRKTNADIEKAKSVLRSLINSGSFYQCLPDEEIAAVRGDLNRYSMNPEG